MNKNKYEEFDNEFAYEDDDEIQIDWSGIFRKLLAKWKLLAISAVVTIVVAAPIILTIPKYYTVEVKLAPELSSGKSSGGGLSSLMSSFGIGGLSSSGADAIGPTLYPDLMNSKVFVISLFDIPVQSKDKKIKKTYAEYLAKDQKAPIWSTAMKGLFQLFSDKKPKPLGTPNAAALTKSQSAIAGAIAANVTCDVDKKTGVITIDVKDQDPVICAAVADSTCSRLQEFITEYRSKKAKKEMIDAEKQYNQAKADYEAAKQVVEGFNDSNWDLVDQDMMVQQQDLQNKMQLAFQAMSAYKSQLMSARTKYQTSLPVFTVLDGASVPLKPSGPKRSLFLLVLLFLVIGGESAWILLKDKLKSTISAVKTPAPPKES